MAIIESLALSFDWFRPIYTLSSVVKRKLIVILLSLRIVDLLIKFINCSLVFILHHFLLMILVYLDLFSNFFLFDGVLFINIVNMIFNINLISSVVLTLKNLCVNILIVGLIFIVIIFEKLLIFFVFLKKWWKFEILRHLWWHLFWLKHIILRAIRGSHMRRSMINWLFNLRWSIIILSFVRLWNHSHIWMSI